MSLGKHVTQSGFYDDGSESAQASRLADEVYGRDTSGHIIALYTAPEGKTVDDPAFKEDSRQPRAGRTGPPRPNPALDRLLQEPRGAGEHGRRGQQHAFMSIQLKGDNDDTILNNFKEVQHDFAIDGVDVKQAGLQPRQRTDGNHRRRPEAREVLAIPLVAVVLFFVFGGVVAASLPAIVGGLTAIAGRSGSCGFSPR